MRFCGVNMVPGARVRGLQSCLSAHGMRPGCTGGRSARALEGSRSCRRRRRDSRSRSKACAEPVGTQSTFPGLHSAAGRFQHSQCWTGARHSQRAPPGGAQTRFSFFFLGFFFSFSVLNLVFFVLFSVNFYSLISFHLTFFSCYLLLNYFKNFPNSFIFPFLF